MKNNGIYRKWDQDKIATWWTQQWHRLCGRSWHGFQQNLWKNRRNPNQEKFSPCFVVTKYQVIRLHSSCKKVRMKNNKYTSALHYRTIKTCQITATRCHGDARLTAHLSNRRLTAYLRILWENEHYMACRGTFNICFSTTCILVLPTVFEQHDAEVPEVRVYTCCRFWHWLGDWACVKNWIFVTSCYVMASVHIWNVKYNFNRMFCAVSPQVLRTTFY